MRTRPLGSLVGAVAGLAFVLLNAGAVPATRVWQVLAVVAALVIAWFVVLRGPRVTQAAPDRAAVRTYGFAVTAMLVAIPVGASLLTNVLDRPHAVVVWVVLVVGAHFLPFARAFALPVFRILALSLLTVAVVGAVPTLASDSATAAGWTGVAAGFVLQAFSAVGPSLGRRSEV